MCKFISKGKGHTGPFTWRPEYNLRCCSTGTNYYFFQVTICHQPVAFQVGEAGWCSALGICLFLPPQFYGFRCVPPHRPWGSNFMFRTCKAALCWLSHPLNPCLFIYLLRFISFILDVWLFACVYVCVQCAGPVCAEARRGSWIFWNWSLLIWEPNSSSLEEQKMLQGTVPSLYSVAATLSF